MTTSTSACRSCGAPIEWTDSPNGKRVPVDVDTGESHFKTCPDAKTWSKPANGSSAQPSATPNRDRTIARMSALRSAAIFAGHKSTVVDNVGTAEVLKIAQAFLQWIEKGGD